LDHDNRPWEMTIALQFDGYDKFCIKTLNSGTGLQKQPHNTEPSQLLSATKSPTRNAMLEI